MARQPRFVLPGQPQHIIQRGNNRQAIFYSQNDYEYYLEKLLFAANEYNCHIHAYVLMTNHVHLLLTPTLETSISKMMQTLGRYYVQYFNYKYHRTGTLWEGRYKASLIDSEHYLFSCMRYIELNPVRAKMVSYPFEYPWSSYHYNALGKTDALVSTHIQYDRLGKNEQERQRNYKELFALTLEQKMLSEIRESSNKGWILGDNEFKETVERKLNRKVTPGLKGGDRKSSSFRAKIKIN